MFVCSTEKDAKKRVRKLGALQEIVTNIQDKMLVPCSLACCPACSPPCLSDQETVKPSPPPPPQPPDVMVCYKVEKKRNGRANKKTNSNKPIRGKKRAKSRELRAGIFYQGCDCEKRNGLQDDCRRTDCHGSPECLTKPDPTCGPSEFSNGKHLGKIFGNGNKGIGGEIGDDDDDDGDDGKVIVSYNCYPATITTTC